MPEGYSFEHIKAVFHARLGKISLSIVVAEEECLVYVFRPRPFPTRFVLDLDVG
jgi:hypothetical protein